LKKKLFVFAIFLFGLIFIPSSFLNAQGINLEWNTFMGSSGYDYAYGITVGDSGYSYVTGGSEGGWGSFGYNGGYDAYVACLDGSGNLVWHIWLGSANYDFGWGIVLGNSGNVYVIGNSEASWGTPINGHSGGWEAFVACINSSGILQWTTFLGSSSDDSGWGIDLDGSGNIYATGHSGAWGSPINAHSGNEDAFVACLNSAGTLQWNTFMGSNSNDRGEGIVLSTSGNIYVTGSSNATWGTPVNAYNAGTDGFVACLNSSGTLQWNTFMGSGGTDRSRGIALNNSGNIVVTGEGTGSWGSPINAHTGNYDVFVACLNSTGSLQWNTFFGSANSETSMGIAMNSSGSIYICCYGYETWGSPVHAYHGGSEATLICLDSLGNLQWNTFWGSSNLDYSYGIALDSSGNIYMVGDSNATWGSPVVPYQFLHDGFVAKISVLPLTDITANGSDGPIIITQSDSLQIRVSLDRFGLTDNVDYWLAYKGPSGWVHYNNTTKKWEPGLGVTHQGALFDLNNKRVFQASGLSTGVYTFYFGVDMNMDGNLTKSKLYYDQVKVTVTQ
jgi:hypothetical protein